MLGNHNIVNMNLMLLKFPNQYHSAVSQILFNNTLTDEEGVGCVEKQSR